MVFANSQVSVYSPADLSREARRSVRGLGRFIRYEIRIQKTGRVSLVAYFVRHFNPTRPVHVQAVESTTVAI